MTALELTVSVALLGTFVGLAVAYQRQAIRRGRELALRSDLQTLRAAEAFFEATRGARPATLQELAAQPIGQLAGRGGIGRWSLRDRGQRLSDVFGTPYRYDSRTGGVSSATPGYESW